MAIQSVAGGEPTDTGGVRTATGGADTELVQGGATATPEEAATQEAARVAALAAAGNTTEATTTDGNLTVATTEETPAGEKPKTLAEVPAAQIDTIKTNLKAAGGVFADPRYEAAAIEYEALGAVTPETLKTTADAFGVTVETAQAFIDGQAAQRALAESKAATPSPELIKLGAAVSKVVPTEAEYVKVLAWGKENLSPAEQTAYDRALDAHDADTAEALLTAYYGRYKAAGNGPGPRDITQEGGGADTAGAVNGYASSAEMQADMNNPRYASDAAFRATVERKVAASKY